MCGVETPSECAQLHFKFLKHMPTGILKHISINIQI